MGLIINNGEINSIYLGSKSILAIYYNNEKIWPKDITPIIDIILSCYYNGHWIDEYPWTDDTTWTD